MDTDADAGPFAPAGGDAMDTGEVRATGVRVARPVMKRGARTTKQRRRAAAKASKAASKVAQRLAKAAKKTEKKAVRASGKQLWAGGDKE